MNQIAALIIGVGILFSILGILAFFIPALTKIFDFQGGILTLMKIEIFPGNERAKALAVLIGGIIISVIGYLYR